MWDELSSTVLSAVSYYITGMTNAFYPRHIGPIMETLLDSFRSRTQWKFKKIVGLKPRLCLCSFVKNSEGSIIFQKNL